MSERDVCARSIACVDAETSQPVATEVATRFPAGPVPPVSHLDDAVAQPKVSSTPEIAATDAAMGERAILDLSRVHATQTVSSGVQYYSVFRRAAADQPLLWKDEYLQGHSDCDDWLNPRQTSGFMYWELKFGYSASAALKSWLRGLTIADCMTTAIACQLDAVRAAVGDAGFDRTFGSADLTEDEKIPMERRLRILPDLASTPLEAFLSNTQLAKEVSERADKEVSDKELLANLKVGQWYYFANHPGYVKKHPFGLARGENLLYAGLDEKGEHLWSGLSANRATTATILDNLKNDFNRPRDSDDEWRLRDLELVDADGRYVDPSYDPASPGFVEHVELEDILREGGFVAESGRQIDVAAVKEIRGG